MTTEIKFVQITSSKDELFALDASGRVYEYHNGMEPAEDGRGWERTSSGYWLLLTAEREP